jgi:hypothetical protein
MPPIPHSFHKIKEPKRLNPVDKAVDTVTPAEFLEHTWLGTPIHFKAQPETPPLPVMGKWFDSKPENGQEKVSASSYMRSLGATVVDYEVTSNRNLGSFLKTLPKKSAPQIQLLVESLAANKPFVQVRAPLDLFLAALDYNNSHPAEDKVSQIYIAQTSVANLPARLQQDLPPPDFVAGNGMYNSSIWLGLTPTYTPLHCDPNPNLFRQLRGSKIVRLIPPRAGHNLYARIQTALGLRGNPRLRGEEMMHGPEKESLHEAVWDDLKETRANIVYETRLDPGDALYLPMGWWHSIKSTPADGAVEAEGELNCSVNWWFRYRKQQLVHAWKAKGSPNTAADTSSDGVTSSS